MTDRNHPLCDACWRATMPLRIPHRMPWRASEVCCRCGEATASGIYVQSAAPLPHHAPGRHI